MIQRKIYKTEINVLRITIVSEKVSLSLFKIFVMYIFYDIWIESEIKIFLKFFKIINCFKYEHNKSFVKFIN